MSTVRIFNDLAPGHIATIAGVGYSDGVPAKEADIGWPMGVVRRADGDLLFADIRAQRIWRLDGEGILHAFAGDGVADTAGDGVPALEARLHTPHDLCLDRAGHLFFSQLGLRGPDEGPNIIRRIDAGTGIITTVAGSGRNRAGRRGPAGAGGRIRYHHRHCGGRRRASLYLRQVGQHRPQSRCAHGDDDFVRRADDPALPAGRRGSPAL